MPHFTVALLLCFLLGLPASAQVTLDQWGAFATTASADCVDFCDPLTDPSWFLTLTFGPSNGGAMEGTTSVTLANARGDSFAESSVLGSLAPVIRVDANANAGGWMDGTGTAVQGYTYVGLVPDTIDVNVQLTGTIGNPDADPSTGLASQVSYVGDANVASLLFENAVIGLVIPDGAVQLEQTADGVVNLSDVLQIPVAPGDQFYLIASSAATAGGVNAFAESLGTLTIGFDPGDAANLVVAGAPVVPAMHGLPAALLGLTLAGIAAVGFRKRGRS